MVASQHPGPVPRVRRRPNAPSISLAQVFVGVSLACPCGWLGCAAEQTVEATVDAEPGIRQVGSADGPLLDEAEACTEIRDALLEAKSRLGCDDVAVADCPDLIRPGGSLACLRFSEESVDACSGAAADYGSCSDFTRDACVVVAVTSETSEGCVPPGAADGGSNDDGDSGDGADDDVADDDTSGEGEADSGSGGAGSGTGGSGGSAGDEAGGSGGSAGSGGAGGSGSGADDAGTGGDGPSIDSGVSPDAGSGAAGAGGSGGDLDDAGVSVDAGDAAP